MGQKIKKMIEIYLITLTAISASPSFSDDYREAADYARRAILEMPEVKERVKYLSGQAERTVLNYTGFDKKNLIYFTWAVPVATGKISSKPFKNFGWVEENWSVRPEIEYDLYNQGAEGSVRFNYEF